MVVILPGTGAVPGGWLVAGCAFVHPARNATATSMNTHMMEKNVRVISLTDLLLSSDVPKNLLIVTMLPGVLLQRDLRPDRMHILRDPSIDPGIHSSFVFFPESMDVSDLSRKGINPEVHVPHGEGKTSSGFGMSLQEG
jgi:hypothetical protein